MRLHFLILSAILLAPSAVLAEPVQSAASPRKAASSITHQVSPAPGGSVSCGSTNRGALHNAVMLSTEGLGFVMAQPWRSRGTRFGTTELVDLVRKSSADVAHKYPGSQLSVADMSRRFGGPIPQHRSHQNGRDVDLIYYAMDADGRPFYPDSHMAYYSRRGRATYAKSPQFVKNIPERYFDLERNWALVRSMIFNRNAHVERIFVSPRVKRWLLRYARQILEEESVMKVARRLLHSPRGVHGHNDHMHVRISCSPQDVTAGRCRQASATPPRHARRWYRKVRCPKSAAIAPSRPRI